MTLSFTTLRRLSPAHKETNMAGDIGIRERALILPEARSLEAARFGRDRRNTARCSYVWIARGGDGRLGRRPRARGDGRFDRGIHSGAAARCRPRNGSVMPRTLCGNRASISRQKPRVRATARVGIPARRCSTPAPHRTNAPGTQPKRGRWPKRRRVNGSPARWPWGSSSWKARTRT